MKKKFWITDKAKFELFDRIFAEEHEEVKDEDEIEYLWSPDYLEQICLGNTDVDDNEYTPLINKLKKEYSLWKNKRWKFALDVIKKTSTFITRLEYCMREVDKLDAMTKKERLSHWNEEHNKLNQLLNLPETEYYKYNHDFNLTNRVNFMKQYGIEVVQDLDKLVCVYNNCILGAITYPLNHIILELKTVLADE